MKIHGNFMRRIFSDSPRSSSLEPYLRATILAAANNALGLCGVRASSQTLGLERGWKRWAKLRRDALRPTGV